MTVLGNVFSREALRRNLILVFSVIMVAGLIAVPAQAQDHRNRADWGQKRPTVRKSEKAQRKAARQAQQDYNGNGVIDRSNRQSYSRDRNYTSTRNRTVRPRSGRGVNDYRNSPVDPYANYPNYRRNPYGNGGYSGNSGYYGGGYNGGYNGGYQTYDRRYYDNREGDEDREEVARRAAQQGYYEGFQRGQYDRQIGARQPKPQGHGAYEFGFSGWNPEWGSAQTYQQYYRQYFVQGYQDGFGQRSMNSRYSRRWW